MLRRLKIGGRVNLLIAVPLLALVATVAMGYVALQRSSVRGEEYKALKSAQDLRADTMPPPASLLESWSLVNHIAVIAATQGLNDMSIFLMEVDLNEIDAARKEFNESIDYWSTQPLEAELQRQLSGVGRDAADRFFEGVDNSLRPAIYARNLDGVLSAVNALERDYHVQKIGVDAALAWSEKEVATREQRTDDYVGLVTLIVGGSVLMLMLLTLLLSVRVRRSIVRPIRALASQAKAVATKELPEVVSTVNDLPADAPVPVLPAFEVNTRDEIAELGASFNSVQDAAVTLAVEQAMARRTVSENLVNIARRNQNLLGRTLGFISTLEQGERDPEVLDNLFRLDHLATRMRRNAQSLLVLAGAEPSRRFAPAVSLGDVVRAALSEVENYSQVELADLGDVGIQGAIAPEVAHLLAELLENATSFSPPNSSVTVVGRAVPDGHQLAIFDYGLGMTADELADANRRLNEVSSFERQSNRMLGFQVVARLAARHDIKVMLTTTPGGTGVTAIVRLPKSILEAVAPVGTTSPIADFPSASEKLAAPLPVASVTPVVTAAPKPTEMSDEALWASMRDASAHDELPLRDVPAPMAVDPAPSPAPAPTSLGDRPVFHVPPVQVPAVHTPVFESAPSDASAITAGGLPKRVRGAQMPDLGIAQVDATAARPADEVRSSLARLQRGIDLGRQQGSE